MSEEWFLHIAMVVGRAGEKQKEKEYFLTHKIYMKFKFQCVNSFTGNEKKIAKE